MITVISAATVCTIITRIAEKQGMTSSVIKILSGLFLAICVISPVIKISFNQITDYLDSIQIQAASVSDYGTLEANSEKEAIIKDCFEAYIVDKAKALGLTIQAQVELDEQMIPVSVKLTGTAAPYGRRKLESYITDTLGIPKEEQMWK